MPITASKGHSQRVLEYKAGLHGIVCNPRSIANPDGWWYPEGVRTERNDDTPATPYVLLSNKDDMPLNLYRPKKIGVPGNESPAGGEYWVSTDNPKLAVSWNHTGIVYMRGVEVLSGLEEVLAATICGPWLVVWADSGVYKCLIALLAFRGDASANNGLLEPTGTTYNDDDFASSVANGGWGAYISPLGSKVVLLTKTKIRTFTLTCSSPESGAESVLGVSKSEADQNTPPNMDDLARLTLNDDYVWTEGVEGNNWIDTMLGGFDASVSANYNFEYQYGVTWNGESPNPVMLEISRSFEFSFDMHADAFYQAEHYTDSGDLVETSGGGTFVKQVDYAETHSSVITGLSGEPIEVLNKAMTNSLTRTQTCDDVTDVLYVENGFPHSRCTINIEIAGTDTTTKRTPTIIAGDGSASVFVEYQGDESADDVSFEYEKGVYVPIPAQVTDEVLRYYPTGEGGIGTHSLGGLVDITYSGSLQETVIAVLDGEEVLRHAREPKQDAYPAINGFFLFPGSIEHRTYAGYSFPDSYTDNGRVASNEDLFKLGFMPVSAESRQGRTNGRRAQYGGKTVLEADREPTGEAQPFSAISDHGDGASFLDIPSDAYLYRLSVI